MDGVKRATPSFSASEALKEVRMSQYTRLHCNQEAWPQRSCRACDVPGCFSCCRRSPVERRGQHRRASRGSQQPCEHSGMTQLALPQPWIVLPCLALPCLAMARSLVRAMQTSLVCAFCMLRCRGSILRKPRQPHSSPGRAAKAASERRGRDDGW